MYDIRTCKCWSCFYHREWEKKDEMCERETWCMREKQRDRAMIENSVMMSIHSETHAERSESCVHRVGTQKGRLGPSLSRGRKVTKSTAQSKCREDGNGRVRLLWCRTVITTAILFTISKWIHCRFVTQEGIWIKSWFCIKNIFWPPFQAFTLSDTLRFPQ